MQLLELLLQRHDDTDVDRAGNVRRRDGRLLRRLIELGVAGPERYPGRLQRTTRQHPDVELREDVLGLGRLGVLDLLPQTTARLELLTRLVDEPADVLRQLAKACRREVAVPEPLRRPVEEGLGAQVASFGIAPGIAIALLTLTLSDLIKDTKSTQFVKHPCS